MKDEGMYKSNGGSQFGNNGGHLMKGLSKAFDDKRIRTGLMLVALLASFSVSGYVLAIIAAPTVSILPEVGPKALGSFTMALNVSNVQDLYIWQTAIVFNQSRMNVVEAISGDFMKAEYPLFVNSTTTANGLLLLCGSLEGSVPGKTGSGNLATIIFEYYVSSYELPSIASQKAGFDTWLEDSMGADISGGQSLLTLTVVG
jgi:hypothetical protein